MNNATMIATVPAAPVAELPSMGNAQAPKPAASVVGFVVANGRTVPMMADRSFDSVSLVVAAYARQGLEDSGISLE